MPGVVNQLLATEVALNKLGGRGISGLEAEQVIWNRHAVIKNRRELRAGANARRVGS